jgi:hypothetical protein
LKKIAKYTILDVPVSCIYNTGIPESLIYTQYRKLQYSSSNNTGNNNTGNTSIGNITILVIPVSRPAASYYPKTERSSLGSLISRSSIQLNDICSITNLVIMLIASIPLSLKLRIPQMQLNMLHTLTVRVGLEHWMYQYRAFTILEYQNR